MLKTVGNPSTRSGDQTIVDGNLVIGTAGKGIDFSVDPAAPGVTSELLDDYEEGVWTPTYVTTGTNFASVTYNAVTGGKYVKIGNMVFIQGVLRTTAIDATGATGDVRIGGLPFPVAANTGSTANGNAAISVGLSANFVTSFPTHGLCNPGSSQIIPYINIAGNPLAIGNMATGASSNNLRFSACYITT